MVVIPLTHGDCSVSPRQGLAAIFSCPCCTAIHEGAPCPRCGYAPALLLFVTSSVPQWLRRSDRGFI
jgi:hypothetical protein